MNFIFYYILVDWEGSAYNNQILENTLFKKDFCISNRKYY